MASTLKKHSMKIALAKQLIKTASKTKIKKTKGRVHKGKGKGKGKGKKTRARKPRTTVYTNILGKTLKLTF
tara:strand:- start:460 stop:672 length:213 start_codon:yes stop_codon:yes gene_type:complete